MTLTSSVSMRCFQRLIALPLLLLVVACGGPPRGPRSADPFFSAAKKNEMAVTTGIDLFARGAPLADWQKAFQATPEDMELFEAFAYRQLLRNISDTTVEEALLRVDAARVNDPFVPFMQAYRMQLEAGRVREDQATRLEDFAASIRDELALAEQRDPDNAFYYYQEATFWFSKGDMPSAWSALDKGNSAKVYRHPFASPLPRELESLEDLPTLMGTNMGVYFQSTPRMFLVQVHGQFQKVGTAHASDAVASRRVLLAARRQLELIPFDLPSYQAAIGLNKTVWKQQKDAGYGGADAVLAALTAFDEPIKENVQASETAAREMKKGVDEPTLRYAAQMLAQTLTFRDATLSAHQRLLAAIDENLPDATSASPTG